MRQCASGKAAYSIAIAAQPNKKGKKETNKRSKIKATVVLPYDGRASYDPRPPHLDDKKPSFFVGHPSPSSELASH